MLNDWGKRTYGKLSAIRVLILGIRRENGVYLGAPSSVNRIEAADTLVIYGPVDRIEELDSRSLGVEGDQAHQTATEEYDEYLEELKDGEQVTVGGG